MCNEKNSYRDGPREYQGDNCERGKDSLEQQFVPVENNVTGSKRQNAVERTEANTAAVVSARGSKSYS